MSLDSRNAELNKRIKDTDLPAAVEVLLKDARKRSRQVKLLAISLALDILLTFGFGFVSFRTAEIASQADSNSAALQRTCESTNEARANNKKLWDYLFAQPPAPDQTPEQAAAIAQFKVFVDKTFAPRDCDIIDP